MHTPLPLVFLLSLALLASCSRRPQPAGLQTSPAATGQLTIAVIPKSTGAEFWETVEEGARQAADELDVEIHWEGPIAETEIAEQNKIIENMVNLQVDGIALAPLNPKAMRKPVETAVSAGIPVVIFDSAIDGDAHTSFVATDNRQGGVLGAEKLLELLGEADGKKVMLMRFIQGTASTEARAQGFLETAKAAGLQVAADPFSEDATVAGCKKTAANTLEGFVRDGQLELDGIFACNDRASLGMLAALEDLRKSNVKVATKFVGFDFTPRLVEALEHGGIDALVVQNPRKMGYLAVKTLALHLRGEPAEARIDTGVEVVTRQRLESDEAIRQLVGAK
ncbi:MAG: substrate-binding domain-containing protein [Rhodopirellula sp.]|nr:substrate-binding domain-containing protein [Rhodopirellula sp.]